MNPPGELLLLVDDQEENLDFLSRRLERKGFRTVCARSGPPPHRGEIGDRPL